MPEPLRTIYQAPTAFQAHLLKQLLAERDIPCRVVGDAILNVESLNSPVSVLVPESHAELGRFIADAFDRHVIEPKESQPHDEAASSTDANATSDIVEWDQWPACSRCGAKRMTWCPSCGTIGANFPAADMADPASPDGALLICSICDEPFAPQFYRCCAECGRQFADGVEETLVSAEAPHQVWKTVVSAFLFLAVFTCVAWWILRS